MVLGLWQLHYVVHDSFQYSQHTFGILPPHAANGTLAVSGSLYPGLLFAPQDVGQAGRQPMRMSTASFYLKADVTVAPWRGETDARVVDGEMTLSIVYL